MTIRKLAYELYKIDWERNHMITADRKMDAMKNYFEALMADETRLSYDDYLQEYGYDGELYVCYDEFIDNEYIEDDYICGLLDNPSLINMYYKDV